MAGRLSSTVSQQDDRVGSTAHGERARDGKHDDFLSSPLFGDGVGGDWWSAMRCVR